MTQQFGVPLVLITVTTTPTASMITETTTDKGCSFLHFFAFLRNASCVTLINVNVLTDSLAMVAKMVVLMKTNV